MNITLELPSTDLRNMPESAAILLAFVRYRAWGIHENQSPGQRCVHPDSAANATEGWYLITGEDIEQVLGFGPWKYVKYLKWLAKAKYIQIEKRGWPGLRWVKILK